MTKSYDELLTDLSSYNERTKTATETYESSLGDIVTATTEVVKDRNNANKWASESEDVLVDDGVNTPDYSANHYSKKAAASADLAANIADPYKGLWPDSGGSAEKGDEYQTQTSGTPTGQYFTALQNTTVDPVSDDVNWREVVSEVSLIASQGLSSGLEVEGDISNLSSISDFYKVYSYDGDYYTCPTATSDDPVTVSFPLSNLLFKKVSKRGNCNTSEVDLFIVYGQSNALGYGNSNVFDYDREEQDPNAVRWDGTKLAPMYWKMPSSSGGVSSGNAWTAYTKRYGELSNRKAVIIPCAKGETSIAELSKGTTPYTNMLSWVDSCKTYLTNNGYTVGRVSVLFSQGETDVVNGTTRSSYLTSAGQLWSDLKTDTGAEVLIISSLGSTETQGEAKCSYIRLAQYHWAKTNHDVVIGFDNAKAFTQENSLLRSDGVHYTLRGYHLMGLGMANSTFNYYEGKTTPELDGLLNNYGKVESVGNNLRKMISFSIQKVSGSWSIIGSSQFNNTCAISLQDNTNEILVGVGFPVTGVTDVNATFNFLGNRAGCYARLNWSGEQVSIKFEMDVNLNVNMTTSQVYVFGNDAASASGKFSYAQSSAGQGTLTVPINTGLPIASNATGGACAASIASATEIGIKAWNETFNLSDEKVYISLNNVTSDSDLVPDGTVLTVSMESAV